MYNKEYSDFLSEMTKQQMFSSKENLISVIELGQDRLKDGNYLKLCDLCMTLHNKLPSTDIDDNEDDDEDDDDEEEEVVFVCPMYINGTHYFLDSDSILYYGDTLCPAGLWNPETREITELDIHEDSDDE